MFNKCINIISISVFLTMWTLFVEHFDEKHLLYVEWLPNYNAYMNVFSAHPDTPYSPMLTVHTASMAGADTGIAIYSPIDLQ